MVTNRILLVVGCITSFWQIWVRFELLWILLQMKDKYLFFRPMKIHTMIGKVKTKQYFIFINSLSYINLYRKIVQSLPFVLCWNPPFTMLIRGSYKLQRLLKIKCWKNKSLAINKIKELVTQSEIFNFFNFELVTRKQKIKSLTIELVTRSKIKYFSAST